MTARPARKTAAGAVLFLGLCLGCSTVPDWVPPWWPGSEEPAPIETPAQRVERYRQLEQQAASLSPQQQQQLSQQLAQALSQEPDPLVRQQLVRTLGRFPTQAAAAALFAALKDESTAVQLEAVAAWGRRSPQEALPVLQQLLQKPDTPLDVRLAAVRALGELKSPQAVQVLAPLLDDPDPAIQYRTVRSLEQLTGKRYGDDVTRWKRALAGQPVEEEPLWSVQSLWRRLF